MVSSTGNTTVTCTSDELQCADGLACYMVKFRCDGFHDCEDYSDEAGCSDRQVECDRDEFYCEVDNECLPDLYRCDGYEDCPDGTDEQNCELRLSFEMYYQEQLPNNVYNNVYWSTHSVGHSTQVKYLGCYFSSHPLK